MSAVKGRGLRGLLAGLMVCIVHQGSFLVGFAQSNQVSAPVGYVKLSMPAQNKVLTSLPFEPFDASLSTVLGSSLTGGEKKDSADQLMIWNPQLQQFSTHWKSLEFSAGQSIWVDEVQGGVSKQWIVPGMGFWVVNNQATDQPLILCGRVVMDDSRTLDLCSGYNLMASPYTLGTPLILSDAGSFAQDILGGADEIKDSAGNRTIRFIQGTEGDGFVVAEDGHQPIQQLTPGDAYWYHNRGDLAFTWNIPRSYPNLFGTVDQTWPRIVNMEAIGDQWVLAVEPAGEQGETLELYVLDFADLAQVDLGSNWKVVATNIAVPNNKTVQLIDTRSDAQDTEAPSGSGRLYLVARGDIDSDKDGLPDARERFVHGSNPLLADSDQDGLPDGWEAAHRFDLTRADANLDTDGDGFSNAEEFDRNTDPRDAESAKVTWYANSEVGNDEWTGRASLRTLQEGPFCRINKALDKAIKGDRVEVATGLYDEDVDCANDQIMTADV